MPRVTIYQDLIGDVQEILEVIKDSETPVDGMYRADPEKSIEKDDHGIEPIPYDYPHVIRKWVPWYEFGEMSTFSFDVASKFDEKNQKQNECFLKLSNAVKVAFDDYAKEWSNEKWMDYVKNWEMYGGPFGDLRQDAMQFVDLTIHKHYINEDKKLALPLHTDFHSHQQEEPGIKPIVTVTIYLNDDYEGGEIQFINTDTATSTVYKPKAGDITIFPSIPPYWHAAKSVKGTNKYMIRSFLGYYYEGSHAWHENVRKYGKENWEIMERKRIEDESRRGLYGLTIEYEKDSLRMINEEKKIFIENEVYIDGRSYIHD